MIFPARGLGLEKSLSKYPEPGFGQFGPNWEGPYKVIRVVRSGVYELEDLNGRPFGHPWNAEHLKKYYQ